jgi:hypothetical protein
MGFIIQHPLFGAAAALAFLTADFLDAGALGIDEAALFESNRNGTGRHEIARYA